MSSSLATCVSLRDARACCCAAGCPIEPEEIGITRDRLRLSYEQAYYIRRRFTVLDVAMYVGVFGSALGELFGQGGGWAPEGADRDQKSRSDLLQQPAKVPSTQFLPPLLRCGSGSPSTTTHS